jgi:hypothetical protein
MKNLGWPAMLALAVVGIVLAGLGGALIANATNDEEDPGEVATTIPAAATTTTAEAPKAQAAGTDTQAATVIDDDVPLGKAEAQRVGKAAVKVAGGGTVTEIGRSDDPGETYEVEVLTDRGEIDIALDQNLNRVQNLAYDD